MGVFFIRGDYMARNRPDQQAGHSGEFQKNRQKIFKTQNVCAICGKPVDKSLKYPHPLSKTVDHIIPVSKGGHPSDINNLQLAHWTCNRAKGANIEHAKKIDASEVISNRNLPHSLDWKNFKKRSIEETEE